MSLNLDNMNDVAEAMTASGKGILAADESTGTVSYTHLTLPTNREV